MGATLKIWDTYISPATDALLDLGSSSLEFKDLYIDGTANIDALVADTADINGGTLAAITIDGNWTALSQTCANLGTVTAATSITTSALVATTADINAGTVDAITSLTVANSVDIGNFTLTANGLTIDGTFTDGVASLTGGALTGINSINVVCNDNQVICNNNEVIFN